VKLLVAAAALMVPAMAGAAPSATVHGHTGDVRVCLPLDGGGALVGTGGGLLRVDATGATTAVWTARDGLPGTRIESLSRDGATVWVGADGGVAQVALGTAGAPSIARTVAERPVRAVVTHKGVVYIATAGNGVKKLGARGAGTAVPFRSGGMQARQVTALAALSGSLHAGTAAGLFVLRGARFEPVKLDGPRQRGGAPQPAVTGLATSGSRLWIATSDGLFVRDAGGAQHVGGGELEDVTVIADDVIVAGRGDGLQRADRGRLIALEGAPRGLRLARTVRASNGVACAGGLDGLWLRARADAPWIAAAPAAPGLPSNDVSALAADGDRLWVGTFDQGLVVRERGAWQRITHTDIDLRINALLVEPLAGGKTRLWIASAAGLMSLDGPAAGDVARLTRRDGLPGRSVMSLARLRDGRLVAGTSLGAAIVTAGAMPSPLGPPGDELGNVWAVAEDADGMVWLGTTTGVWRGPSTPAAKGADRRTGWARMSVATGHLVDDWVMALVARDRSVWVGGYKGGVVRFDLADLTKTTPIGGGWINPGGLSWDGAELVAATQEGLRRGDGATTTWRTEPGMPGKDVTAVARTGTTRWIGTRRGLIELRR
jgi:ligand-binding sensor domain-containing protein